MFSKKIFFLFLFLTNVIVFPQALRKSSVAFSTGFVSGEDNFQYSAPQITNQVFIWANYTSSELHSFSAIYRKFGLGNNENLNSYLIGVNSTLNFFPWYFSFSYAYSEGPVMTDNELIAEEVPASLPAYNNIYAFSLTYYRNLFFYTLKGNYILWKDVGGENKIVFALAQVTWRPSLWFYADIEAGITYDENNKDNFFTYNFSLNWKPANFLTLSVRQMLGERKFYYNSDLMVYYDKPYLEKETENYFLIISPSNKLDLILNYENRQYDEVRTQYYSFSIKIVL